MGRLISIMGGKDGIGKSTFAMHLAYGLFRNSKERVCLIEGDTGNLGDLQILMNYPAVKFLGDLTKEIGRMDPKLVQKWIGNHPLGFSLLGCVSFVTDLQRLDDESLEKTFRLLKRSFDTVIVDAGRELTPLSFRVLEQSDSVFIMTAAEILSLNQTGELVKKLRALHFGNEMFHMVLNKADPRAVINPQMVRHKTQLDTKIILSNDPVALQQCVSQSKPLQLLNSRHPYLKGIDEAIRMLGSGASGGATPVRVAKKQSLEVLRQVLPFTFGNETQGAEVARAGSTPNAIMERNLAIRKRVHERLLELVDLRQMDALELESNPKKKEELRNSTVQAVHKLLEEEALEVTDRNERAALAKDIIDEALGLGAIEPLLASNDVTEIMVNGPQHIFVEEKGRIFLSDLQFTTEKHLMGCIDRIVSPIGRRVDEKTPLCDARLHDGSRINVIIPPLALDGPTLTIRKFFKDKLEISDLVKYGTLTDDMADFLRAAVQSKLNIVVSGGTGSGKTTLLNLTSGFIPENERIITVEDAAELQLPQPHVISLESRPANIQGEGAISIRDLVKNTLRMRPDRIVVGECRGGEALDMLQAMNTGHDGSLTTIHANNPRDCLRRIETLVMMAGFDLPMIAIREQIASAVNLIVQLRRYSDGTRKISHITEVMGIEGETVVTQPIFEYKQTGTENGKVKGSYQASGLIPKFVESLQQKGIALPKGLFGGGAPAPAAKEAPQMDSPPKTPSNPTSAPGARRPEQRPVGTRPGTPRSLNRPSGSGSRPQTSKNPKRIPVKKPPGGDKR